MWHVTDKRGTHQLSRDFMMLFATTLSAGWPGAVGMTCYCSLVVMGEGLGSGSDSVCNWYGDCMCMRMGKYSLVLFSCITSS